MRIVYGIHGYGRGHSSRALAVLPDLAARHELLILAGGDAYQALRADYPVVAIPTFRYRLKKSGRRALFGTLVGAVPSVLDLLLRGPALEMVCELVAGFAPDAVVSDSEPWTHRVARRLGIPRISFDRYAALVHCKWPMGWCDRLTSRLESLAYHFLMAGTADRHVIASFYEAPPRRPGVCVVGPVLRDTVRDAEPVRGDYLLAYFSNGHIHFTPRVEQALRASRVPSIVYGTGREGVEGTLDFRPPSNTRFVEHLARCRAVFSTAGNQLISEAIHLRKPLLLMPEHALEQCLNAKAVERLCIGERTSRTRVTGEQIRQFFADEPRYAERFPDHPTDGRARAIAAIERAAVELAASRQGDRA